MGAVLRASGPDFDVDAFLADCPWPDAKTYYRGPLHEESGLNVLVSDVGLYQPFAEAVNISVQFLSEGAPEVRRLAAFPGARRVDLNIQLAQRDVNAQDYWFPAELVRCAAECGIALELSLYRVRPRDAPAR